LNQLEPSTLPLGGTKRQVLIDQRTDQQEEESTRGRVNEVHIDRSATRVAPTPMNVKGSEDV